jgi:hypothetical protein
MWRSNNPSRTMSPTLPVSIRRAKAAHYAAVRCVTRSLRKPSSRVSKTFGPTEGSSVPSSNPTALNRRAPGS